MKKLTFFQLLSVALLVINTILLILFFLGKPPHHGPPPGGPKMIVIDRLHFDDIQIKAYEELIKKHKKEVESNHKKIKELKEKLYQGLATNTPTANSDSLISELNLARAAMEKAHLKHFEKIRSICKEEQMDNFNELTKEIAKFFSPRKPGKP